MTIIYVTCTDVLVADDHLRVLLNCGHSYEARNHTNEISIEDFYTIVAHMIGHQQRCPDCEMAQLEIDRRNV